MPVSSGRAGMTLVLRAMRALSSDPRRNEVIIPGYTCYSVPAAIERAGLTPRLCDVDPLNLGLDPDHLRRANFSRVLAVITANLYGLPNELTSIEDICREQRVFLLDDAAQALGATVNGRPVGSFGDIGLYSFDKGKIVSTIQGGAIVGRDGPLWSALQAESASLPPASAWHTAGVLAKLMIYAALLRPRLYGVVHALPFTGLGQTIYETQYSIAQLSPVALGVATSLLRRVDQLNSGRRRQAASLRKATADLPGVVQVEPVADSVAVFARFPVRLLDPARRSAAIVALNRAGIGATGSYPLSLADVPEVRTRLAVGSPDCPGAREVASTIVTLPTHAYCPPDTAERVRKVLSQCTA